MPSTPHSLLNYLRTVAGAWREDPRDDAELLARFVDGGDETAFRVLVWRHGPLVWRACVRVLGNGPDSEDAFQITFLALARKAARLRREPLAGWLYRVARQTALNVNVEIQRRQSLEHDLLTAVRLEEANAGRTELYAALDEELAGLPEKLRVPLVLHYLEGKTQDEVARILGCSRTATQKRLLRGEAILRERLERRGLTVGVGLVAVLLTNSVAVSAVPARLIGSTARAAVALRCSFLTGGAAEATQAVLGAFPASLKTTIMRKSLWMVLACCLGLAGAGLVACRAMSMRSDEPGEADLVAAQAPGKPEASGRATARVDCYGDPLPPHALARMGTVRLWQGRDHFEPKLAFSPDGKTLATHIDGMTVCLWDAATGKEIRRLTTETVYRLNKKGEKVAVGKSIASLGFSPDGKTLVAMDNDRAVCRWEVATGKVLRKQQYQGPNRDDVQSFRVAFLPDGQILGFGDFLKSVEKGKGIRGMYVWDVDTGKEICQLGGPRKRSVLDAGQAAFSPDGKLLATALEARTIKKENERTIIISLWDVATGKEVRQLTYEGDHLYTVAVSPGGKTLASGDGEKICVWEIATARKIHQFEPKGGLGFCGPLIYSPDGKTLLGGAEGHLWDVGTGKEIRSFGCEGAKVALFSPDGKTLAIGDEPGAIRLWEVATGKEIGPRRGYRGPISSIAYSSDGKILASVGQEGETTVRLWEAATGKETRPLAKHGVWGPGSIAYSPDGKMLLSMRPSVLYLWDTATGKEIHQFEGRGGGFNWRATFSPDGRKLAAGWRHNLVCVWEVATGQLIYTLETQQKEIGGARQVAIAFSPNSRLLATPGKDNTVSLWEVATGKLIGQLGRPKKRSPGGYSLFVFSLAFSPDGRLLATSSSGELEGKVRVWEVASGKEISQLAALKPRFHDGCLLAFSPDGRMLATVAQHQDGNGHFDTVRLWNAASGKEIGQLAGHRGPVWTIAFSPDGKTLASGSDDLTCLVWDLTPFTGRLKPVPTHPVPSQPLSDERLEAAWSDLAKEPVKAYAAIRALQAAPAQAIPLLRARLRPAAPPPDPEQLQRWIADLGADDFAARDKAQREIGKLGEAALPALRQALKDRPALEMKRRLKDLLAELEPKRVGGTPQCLRELRAVQVLESIGTVEARQVLQALAKGVSGARLTVEAESALARLAKCSAARP